jgi:hypothetical protein
MKFQKPNSKNLTEAVVLGGGVMVGAKLSKGASSVSPIKNATATKAILAAAGVLVAATVKGTDNVSSFAKGAGAGMAAQQLGEIVDDFVKPMLPAPTGTVSKALNEAFGGSTTVVPLETKEAMAARLGRKMGNPLFKMGNAQPQLANENMFAAG